MDDLDSPQDNQPIKRGEFKAYAIVILSLSGVMALLWAIKVPFVLIIAFLFLFSVAGSFGHKLLGGTLLVKIDDPRFERRILSRFSADSDELQSAGFQYQFCFGEATPLYRLLLLFPLFVYAIMFLNREVGAVKGSKLIFGYPVLYSSNDASYALVMQLGTKFHTRFHNGKIVLTKSFGGNKNYGDNVILQRPACATLLEIRAEHQSRVRALEAAGWKVDSEVSFEVFAKISAET